MIHVRVAPGDFAPGAELARLEALGGGGLGCFIGTVRGGAIAALTLEHYPGMTERALDAIADQAMRRFGLLGCVIVHRVGRLLPGERIVLAAAAAAHRAPALEATQFLIDWLKTDAPFWKKEEFADGSAAWVEARAADAAAAGRWR